MFEVRAAAGTAVLLVTHDIDDSVYLADRVLVLSSSPATVVEAPKVDRTSLRDRITTRGSDAFVRLRTDIARPIRR